MRSARRRWHAFVGALGAVFALCVVVGAAHGAEPRTEPRTEVRGLFDAHGLFVFSDGSSVYVLKKDGTFALEPVGISGRTIQGYWQSDDDRLFVVTGQWGWVNGLSRDDDYRRMTFAVTAYPAERVAVPVTTRTRLSVNGAYFVMDELVKTTKAAFDAAKRASVR